MALRTCWRVYHVEPNGWRNFRRDYLSAELAAQVRDDYRAMFPDHRYVARRVSVREISNPRTTA